MGRRVLAQTQNARATKQRDMRRQFYCTTVRLRATPSVCDNPPTCFVICKEQTDFAVLLPNVAPVASSASAKLQKRVDACPGPVSGVIGPRARVLTDLPLGMPIAHSLGALCSLGASVSAGGCTDNRAPPPVRSAPAHRPRLPLPRRPGTPGHPTHDPPSESRRPRTVAVRLDDWLDEHFRTCCFG